MIERYAQSGLVRQTTLGELVTEYTYTDFGEIDTYLVYANGGTPTDELDPTTREDDTEFFFADYEYDELGRIVQITEEVENISAPVKGYEYDVAGRLWRAKKDGVVIAEYEYDLNGNRTAVLDGSGDSVVDHIAHDDQDRLTSYDDMVYAYNNHGELEWSSHWRLNELTEVVEYFDRTDYVYDVFGNLRHVGLPDGTEIDYEIDPLGRRVRRESNGVEDQRLLWDGQLRPVAELDSSGIIETRYVYGLGLNVPDYYERDEHTYRIITDHLGSPRLIVQTDGEGAGTIVFRREYDAWGEIEVESFDDPGEIPFGFAGGLYDEDTGLVRFGFRDYDPEIGRWTAKDPIGFAGGDTNLYGYVGNEPVGRVDRWGLQSGSGCDPTLGRIHGMCLPPMSFECAFPYSPTYAPSEANCEIYESQTAKETVNPYYLQNATNACERTPNDPANNCVRSCLQVQFASYLSEYEEPAFAIPPNTYLIPPDGCTDLYQHHVSCYESCGCESAFIGFSMFNAMCSVPFPGFFTELTISSFNACVP